ncbi:MAG: acyl-CoA dehydrogenase family protein [Planctomycetales bacterium]|nr:acyl-CoA dehydrogenase family protein [Planctomycetales bacterium]
MAAALTDLQKKQMAQAEELLFSGPAKEDFAKDLFLGRFRAASILPYPRLSPEARQLGDEAVAKVRRYCQEHLDAVAVDREACIPDRVVQGLGELGVLGMTISPDHGGKGLSQQNYCRVMEVIGGHCASTAVFVNAHHSIGLRALELFGSKEQKAQWMRPMASGEKLSAFALTEPEAGSDASNVQTTAMPTPDGSGYLVNGEKRWITNGGIADVLTLMVRTPDPDEPDGKITAMLVTPDMEGFRVVEQRMEKVGIRGTATGRLEFRNMFVPKENVLGQVGKGLRIALTVLDFGRTTFGASCTGAAKFCLERLAHRANTRKQFGRHLGDFELVKAKLAEAAADTFAMESATYQSAALIDSGAEDYMVETAMLKVFASDQLWRIVNDTLQVWGGKGFFTDEPFERMMRDARLNMIGEGANDVLRCFIAMVGLRGLGEQLQQVAKKPWEVARLLRFAPEIPVKHERLRGPAGRLAKQIGKLARVSQAALIKYREAILDQQFVQARIGDIATELFMASCVYARLDSMLTHPPENKQQHRRQLATGELYLKLAARRNQARFAEFKSNLDQAQVALADDWLAATDLPLPGEA